MKFGTPAMALAISLFASAVWADTTQNDAIRVPGSAPAATDGANGEQSWKIVDGQSANGANSTTQVEQSASPQDEQASKSTAAGEQDQNGRSDPAASDQAAAEATDDAQDASASNQDDSATDRNAAVRSGDGNADEQSAETTDDGGDLMAAVPERGADDAAQALSVQAQAFQKFMESVQGKLVVILPQGWSGSVQNLLESLKYASDNTEVVVLSQRGDAANTSAPSSDDEDDNDVDDDEDNS